MCLAVPLEVNRIVDATHAVVREGETEVEVDVSLIDDPRPGDWLIVHAGYAIEKLEADDAAERLELFRELGES